MKNEYTNFDSRRDWLRRCRRNSIRGFSTLALCFASLSGLFSGAVVADEMSLLINGKAIHINPPPGKNLNEKNWGLGFQYDWAPVNNKWVPFAMASGFIDSNKNPSYYTGGGAMRRFQYNAVHFDLGAIGFLMTRKGYKNDQPFIGVLPAFSVGTEKISLNMTYIPKVEPKAVPLWFFQIKIRLKAI